VNVVLGVAVGMDFCAVASIYQISGISYSFVVLQ